jgi:Protein of unknown function (DUF3341)
MARREAKIFKTPQGAVIHGMMAEFANPAEFYHACEHVRDAGYKKWDSFAPFPVHGIDEAMGMPTSRLPLLVGILGISGAALGFLFQYVVTHQLYPMIVQGKPTSAWESLAPITFEFGVIFTAFSAIVGMLAFNRLPMWHHPLLKKDRFLRVSDDRFVICIETADPGFDPVRTREVLERAKGYNVDLVEE